MHEDITCEACGCCGRWTNEIKDEDNVFWVVCECGFEKELLPGDQEDLTLNINGDGLE